MKTLKKWEFFLLWNTTSSDNLKYILKKHSKHSQLKMFDLNWNHWSMFSMFFVFSKNFCLELNSQSIITKIYWFKPDVVLFEIGTIIIISLNKVNSWWIFSPSCHCWIVTSCGNVRNLTVCRILQFNQILLFEHWKQNNENINSSENVFGNYQRKKRLNMKNSNNYTHSTAMRMFWPLVHGCNLVSTIDRVWLDKCFSATTW